MQKLDIGQVFADNLRAAIEKSSSIRNPSHLAEKAGVSHGYLSEVLRCISSPTLRVVNDLAHVLGIQPWELLADSEATRQTAMARMLWSGGVSNERMEKEYGFPPKPAPEPAKKKSARSQRKRGRSPPGTNSGSQA